MITEDGRAIEEHHHCACGCGAHMGCYIWDDKEDGVDRLKEILSTMTLPARRLDDTRWLLRNIGFYNLDHPRLDEALVLLNEKKRSESD